MQNARKDAHQLSGWEDDSDEAINVALSLSNAKRWGIEQIAVFADACRSTVKDAASVGGSCIFPKRVGSAGKSPQFDQFYACRLNETAQEIPDGDPLKAYGVFTKCLMSALVNHADEALEDRPPSVVSSQKLAAFLEERVPFESGMIPGALVQEPEVQSGWRRPNDVYVEVGFIRYGQPRPGIGRQEIVFVNAVTRQTVRPALLIAFAFRDYLNHSRDFFHVRTFPDEEQIAAAAGRLEHLARELASQRENIQVNPRLERYSRGMGDLYLAQAVGPMGLRALLEADFNASPSSVLAGTQYEASFLRGATTVGELFEGASREMSYNLWRAQDLLEEVAYEQRKVVAETRVKEAVRLSNERLAGTCQRL